MSDKITIRRAKHDKDNPYFLMRRDTAQDHSISAEALGILTEILSRPDDWRVSPEQLSNRVNTKRARVYRILKELIAARYIERIYHRDSHGRVQWVEYIVHECPLLVISQQVVNQDVAKQDVEIQHNTNKRVKQSTEVTKDSVAAGAATDSGQAPEEPEPQGQLDSEYDTWKAKIENLPAHAPTAGMAMFQYPQWVLAE
jgi:predicted transcriptional regulator